MGWTSLPVFYKFYPLKKKKKKFKRERLKQLSSTPLNSINQGRTLLSEKKKKLSEMAWNNSVQNRLTQSTKAKHFYPEKNYI